MKAIILAGGRGSRLRPLTDAIPKPMVTVGGRPILEHVIRHLKTYDITDIIVSVCYLSESIVEHFGDGSSLGVHIDYTVEDQLSPLGTAGAVKLAQKYIDETCIVTSGDILRTLNIRQMIHQHKKTQAFATLNVYKRYGPDPKSQVTYTQNRRVVTYRERPNITVDHRGFIWANGSFYIFEPEVFRFIPDSGPSDFGHTIIPAVLSGKKSVFAYPTDDYFIDIGNHEKLSEARRMYPSVSAGDEKRSHARVSLAVIRRRA